MNSLERPLLSSVLLALGLALSGLFIGHGFASGRARDRYVEVKGLAEREVTADLALWPLRYATTGDRASTPPRCNCRPSRYPMPMPIAFLASGEVLAS